jgi:hypothetical protein
MIQTTVDATVDTRVKKEPYRAMLYFPLNRRVDQYQYNHNLTIQLRFGHLFF